MKAAADLLIRNARLFTGGDPRAADRFPAWSREGPRPNDAPTAVAVRDGRIDWLGSDAESDARRGPKTEVIDARGGLLTPGFEDAHVHLLKAALSLAQADLEGAASIDEIARRLATWRAANPGSPWVLGRGWHYGTFPGGMPDRTILDRLVPERPALLESFDSHTHWLNSAALSAAGITATTADLVNGTIERDGGGQPTGILKEFAPETLDAVVPSPTDAQLDALLRDALGTARRLGVTALQDAWTEPRSLQALRRLRDDGALDVRVRVAAVADPSAWRGALAAGRRAFGDALDAFERELAAIRPDARLRGGVVKAFADGVVESGTAWLLEPYEGEVAGTGGDGAKGPAVHGRPNWSAAALAEMTATAVARGWQVEIHAIGDAAIRAALDAHERASTVASPSALPRGRVEHVEWPHPADVPRFGELGAVASMQPTHALALPHKHSVRERRIGHRVERGWPWASLLASGAIVAFGSDWPIATLDPLRQVHAAVTRRDPAARSAAAWLPDECLTATQAIACATWGSAAAGLAERRRGAIATGMDADLVLLDGDPLSDGADALVDSRVRMTMVAGRVVYRADDR